MPSITAEPASGTTTQAVRRSNASPRPTHAKCACMPGLRQPSWNSECAYCGTPFDAVTAQ